MGRRAKYPQVAERLQRRIRSGAFGVGEPLPSEPDLAEEFGVNRLTLRKAVDLLVEEGLVFRQQGRGTFVRAGRIGEGNGTVLYIGSTEDHFYQPFYSALCREGQAHDSVVAAWSPTGNAAELERVRALASDAVAVVCVEGQWRRVAGAVGEDVRLVLVSGMEGDEGHGRGNEDPCYSVSSDSYRAVKLAVEHLAGLGHRRIALMHVGQRPSEDPLLWHVSRRRAPYLGYCAALREAGIEREYVLAVPPRYEEEWQEGEYQVAKHFLKVSAQRPTAFVCVGDFRAGPLMRAAGELGLSMPGDLSIVGMGNTPWSRCLNPPLTTVDMGEEEMARVAMLLTDEPAPARRRVVRVDPCLVERRSTAPPKEAES